MFLFFLSLFFTDIMMIRFGWEKKRFDTTYDDDDYNDGWIRNQKKKQIFSTKKSNCELNSFVILFSLILSIQIEKWKNNILFFHKKHITSRRSNEWMNEWIDGYNINIIDDNDKHEKKNHTQKWMNDVYFFFFVHSAREQRQRHANLNALGKEMKWKSEKWMKERAKKKIDMRSM